jgi:2'-phosphotransferase
MAHSRFKDATFEAIEKVVKENDKQRFSLMSEVDPKHPTKPNVWWIRANQGHSMKVLLFLTK